MHIFYFIYKIGELCVQFLCIFVGPKISLLINIIQKVVYDKFVRYMLKSKLQMLKKNNWAYGFSIYLCGYKNLWWILCSNFKKPK